MALLVWDSTLEAAAAAWGEQCKWQHDPANQGNAWGENLAFKQNHGNTYNAEFLTGLVEAWYSEVVDVDWLDDRVKSVAYPDPRSNCTSYSSGTDDCMIGHYTQVVWAASTKMGCSVHVCGSMSGTPTGAGGLYLVCKYNPPGNWIVAGGAFQLPFVYGASCAYCYSDCSDNLCTAEVQQCEDTITTMEFNGIAYTDCASLITGVAPRVDWCADYEPSFQICGSSCGECSTPRQLGTDFCGDAADGSRKAVTTANAGNRGPLAAQIMLLAVLQSVLSLASFQQ